MFQQWTHHVVKSSVNKGQGHVYISEDGCTASFLHPGLCYTHFDRDGNVDVRSLMRFVNEVRNTSMMTHLGPPEGSNSNHLDFLRLYQGRLIFVCSAVIEIKPEMYAKSVPKWPLKVKTSLRHVGNSSMTIEVSLSVPVSDASEVALVTQRSTYVLVDRTTRRPKPLPDWFKEKYSNTCRNNSGQCKVETLTKPHNVFVYQAEVLWSDTDGNNHTNWASYVHYTINALRAAIRLRKRNLSAAPKSSTKTTTHTNGIVGSLRDHKDDELNTIQVQQGGDSSDKGRVKELSVSSASASRQVSCSFSSVKSDCVVNVDNDNDINQPQQEVAAGLAVLAAAEGGISISEQVVKSGLKTLRLCFVRESVEGDRLDVSLWQEEIGTETGVEGGGEGRVVKAVIEKDGQSICHLHLEFNSASTDNGSDSVSDLLSSVSPNPSHL